MSSPPDNGRPRSSWPRDRFAREEIVAQFSWVWLIVIAGLAAWLLPLLGKLRPAPTVVVYCAQDQVYAEEIFRAFERQSGIRVLPVYDSEAVKTVGLANRLLAEQARPRADVFWGNEALRARQLEARGVFAETNGLAFFGYRTRRIVVNTNLWSGAASLSLTDLTNAHWRGKVALAFPQFGTTATHFHALRQHWGEAAWLDWCRNLARNQVRLVEGNSTVVKLVGAGEVVVGLTDSDDIQAGQREGLPVAGLPPGAETLYIPNSVGLIHRAPHPESARGLFEYLRTRSVADLLVRAGALEGNAADENAPALKPAWDLILRDLETTTGQLNQIFLR